MRDAITAEAPYGALGEYFDVAEEMLGVVDGRDDCIPSVPQDTPLMHWSKVWSIICLAAASSNIDVPHCTSQ